MKWLKWGLTNDNNRWWVGEWWVGGLTGWKKKWKRERDTRLGLGMMRHLCFCVSWFWCVWARWYALHSFLHPPHLLPNNIHSFHNTFLTVDCWLSKHVKWSFTKISTKISSDFFFLWKDHRIVFLKKIIKVTKLRQFFFNKNLYSKFHY